MELGHQVIPTVSIDTQRLIWLTSENEETTRTNVTLRCLLHEFQYKKKYKKNTKNIYIQIRERLLQVTGNTILNDMSDDVYFISLYCCIGIMLVTLMGPVVRSFVG